MRDISVLLLWNPIGFIALLVGFGLAVRFLFVRRFVAAGVSATVAVVIALTSF